MSAYKKNVVQDARTYDIIYSMAIAAPAAIAQAKRANLPEIIGLTGGNAAADGRLAGQWIRNNVSYKIDTFEDQNIQLPSALLSGSKKGDCKSFSMLFLSIMEAAGYNAGFRFASYKNDRPFTHVYNFVLDNKNNILTFDTCIKDLKELTHYKKIKDMRVNYLAGVPTVITENNKMNKSKIKLIARKPTIQELMSDDRYMNVGYLEAETINGKKLKKFFEKVKTKIPPFVQKGLNKVKTVALAPARGPFLVLVDVNFRGLARKLFEALQKNEAKVKEFWTKLGGDPKALLKAIDKGKSKKPFLGERVNGATSVEFMISGEDSIMSPEGNDEYIGFDPATVTAALTAASGIVAAAMKLIKSLGVKSKKGEGELEDAVDPNTPISPDVEAGKDFFAADPASEGAAKYAASGGSVKPDDKTPGEAVGFKASPILLIGAATVGIFLLTRKNN